MESKQIVEKDDEWKVFELMVVDLGMEEEGCQEDKEMKLL